MVRLDPDAPRCTERVPERLCGGLRGDARPQCKRPDPHNGRHKAERRLRGVGSTYWEWKDPKDWGVQVELRGHTKSHHLIPPLEVKTRTWAPKESVTRKTCECDGLKHKCKRYRGLLRS